MFRRWCFVIAGVSVLALGCEDDSTTTVAGDPCRETYPGITVTDATGARVGEVDPDDWQSTAHVLGPNAYPNPTANACSIEFALTDSLAIEVSIDDPYGKTIWTTGEVGRLAGRHTVAWDLTDADSVAVPDCNYRVWFKVSAPGGVESSHGDVSVKRSP